MQRSIIELRAQRARFAMANSGDSSARVEMRQYMRTEKKPTEMRSLKISDMGVAGDRQCFDQVISALSPLVAVREAGATVFPTANGDTYSVVVSDDSDNAAALRAEGESDNTAADPDAATVPLGAYKFDSKWIKVTSEMMRDASFDVEQYVFQLAGERFGRGFNAYSTTGTGSGQPQGFVTAATVGKTTASTSVVTYEEVLDLVHSVASEYRASGRCTFAMHDTTLEALKKLKDDDGRYIFREGEAAGSGTILGYPYVVNNDMAQLTSGAGSKVIAFGDFSKYFVRDVTAPMVVVARELFAPAWIGYRIWSRHDGRLAVPDAVKTLRLAAS